MAKAKEAWELWENNSGGHFRLTAEGFVRLRDSGWKVPREITTHTTKIEDKLRWGRVYIVASRAIAEATFLRATGYSVYEPGCPCCGRPFMLLAR